VLKRRIETMARRSLDRLLGRGRPEEVREHWAIRGVSFEVMPGEAVAVLGPNGAGKSTLLKVLARITRPSEGRFEVRGKLSALLEVGAGFHPELTGRDNIHLAGVLLGLSRAEVASRFDEIVAFSGVGEEFLDTAVKHYSSGIYLRLGFAVAAHLAPDVLLVDEALSVGDVAFQERCSVYMRSLVERGVSVLLVTHRLELARALCTRAIVLEGGRVVHDGGLAAGIARYEAAVFAQQAAACPQVGP
jgi:lipopolysaccharide transport system ATP-binding protein